MERRSGVTGLHTRQSGRRVRRTLWLRLRESLPLLKAAGVLRETKRDKLDALELSSFRRSSWFAPSRDACRASLAGRLSLQIISHVLPYLWRLCVGVAAGMRESPLRQTCGARATERLPVFAWRCMRGCAVLDETRAPCARMATPQTVTRGGAKKARRRGACAGDTRAFRAAGEACVACAAAWRRVTSPVQHSVCAQT